MKNGILFLIALLPLAASAGEPKLKLEHWQAHYTGKLDNHDWLRPSDAAFAYFVQQVFEGTDKERIDLDYTYRCGKGEFDFCYDKLSYGYGRAVSYVVLVTPLALAVSVANSRRDEFESAPTVEELAQFKGIFYVIVSAQSPDYKDAPAVAIEYKGELITAAETRKYGNDVSECWTWEDEACWNNRSTFVFSVNEDTTLSGEGAIILRWSGSVDVKIPINFDNLW